MDFLKKIVDGVAWGMGFAVGFKIVWVILGALSAAGHGGPVLP